MSSLLNRRVNFLIAVLIIFSLITPQQLLLHSITANGLLYSTISTKPHCASPPQFSPRHHYRRHHLFYSYFCFNNSKCFYYVGDNIKYLPYIDNCLLLSVYLICWTQTEMRKSRVKRDILLDYLCVISSTSLLFPSLKYIVFYKNLVSHSSIKYTITHILLELCMCK